MKDTVKNSNSYFLPDLSEASAVLSMVLSIELIVFMLSLFKFPFATTNFFAYFFGLSVVMLWIAFVFAILMNYLKSRLQLMSVKQSAAIQLIALLIITLFFLAVGRWVVLNYLTYSDLADSFRNDPINYFLQNGLISLIIGGLLMRYFYVTHQNQEKLKAMNAAQVQALQSRIRPHFLFNSLNSIASLVRIDTDKAEQAVEDLSDLFRVSLANSERRVTLKEELEIARIYQRMEQLRLGERLQVKWNVSGLPLKQKVPALILQPLLENSIYHGIEPLLNGGTVNVNGFVEGKRVYIEVSNPIQTQPLNEQKAQRKQGNKIALENIRSRLRLLYGEKANVSIVSGDANFKVRLDFPLESEVQ